MEQVDHPVAVDVARRQVQVVEPDDVGVLAGHPCYVEAGRRAERIGLSPCPVEEHGVLPPVEVWRRHHYVMETIRVDVEEVRERLVHRVSGASRHRVRSLVEPLPAGNVRRRLLAARIVRRHVLIAERHRRKPRTRRRRQKTGRRLGDRLAAAPLHLQAREERYVIIRVVSEVVASHELARPGISEIFAGYVDPDEPEVLMALLGFRWLWTGDDGGDGS
ncbi:MAG: hypothetical protein ACRENE_25975, partial [Polyangiaceae bacterium]